MIGRVTPRLCVREQVSYNSVFHLLAMKAAAELATVMGDEVYFSKFCLSLYFSVSLCLSLSVSLSLTVAFSPS